MAVTVDQELAYKIKQQQQQQNANYNRNSKARQVGVSPPFVSSSSMHLSSS
jgi:hypothetical protein